MVVTNPKPLWLYTIEYVDAAEFIEKGFETRHLTTQMNLDELQYFLRTPAITVLSMSLEPATLHGNLH